MPSRSLERNKSSSRYVGGVLVVLLHVVIVSALLQIASVRSRAAEVAPVFVKLITPATPLADPAPPPPAPKKVPPKQPPRFLVTDVPARSPIELVASEPVVEPTVAAPVADSTPESVVPPVAPAPVAKVISKVEYIRAPQLEYPALSRRIGEHGRVLLRVLIGREGRAERIEVQTSSGSRRLDEAAIKAAREALYRPYSENGVAIPVWALVPTLFELS